MSVEVAGQGGSGSTVVYTMPNGYEAMLEVIRFQVVGSASGNGHSVRLIATSPSGNEIYRLDDLNQGGDSQTNVYTYGLGLNASACTLPSGIAVTDALPWTTLLPQTVIRVVPVDAAGATITGDTISAVLLRFADQVGASGGGITFPDLPLSLLPAAA